MYLFIYYELELEQLSQYNNLLQYERFGFQTSVGARFFASFQTGPKAHPASTTIYTSAFSQGVKWWQCAVDLIPPSSTEVQQIIKLYL